VAEAWRNITAVGGRPLAITDNLNFGNPERPETMGQFVGCVRGIAEACKALDFPVVSGNVSLYNETNGRAILPTPTIGGVGLIDDFTRAASIAFKGSDEAIVLLGETRGWLGQSMYLREICGREEGAPPPVDLAAEKRVGDFVLALIDEGRVTAVHDISDGGLIVTIAEMALASGIGARLYGAPNFLNETGFWFGEDQARYVVTVRADQFDDLGVRAKAAGVAVRRLGVTRGNSLTLPGERPILLDALRASHEGWLPAYMAGGAN
jgi:phosphoribosylformylglycinamidine synthase subunit PurL